MPRDPKFKKGDRVKVKGDPHMKGQAEGTITLVSDETPYEIQFDGMDEPHRWYVDSEIEPAAGEAEGEPRRKRHEMNMGAHSIGRVLRAFASQPWFLHPRKAEQIVAMLELRASAGVRAEPYRDTPAEREPVAGQSGKVAIVRLHGPILPRAEAMTDVSQPAALMTEFCAAFRKAASDGSVSAIVIDVDSPGGQADLVPEAAAMIRNARRAGRPIVAVANTMVCSAAYWVVSGADELVVTPSGEVGSIGVYVLHEDISAHLDDMGVKMTFVSEGPRKTEGNPFEPLTAQALAALRANVRAYYDLFVADVAAGRRVPESVVRGDPERDTKHFGGGRSYPAAMAVKLGMADRVDTLEATIERLQRGTGTSTASARRRAAIL